MSLPCIDKAEESNILKKISIITVVKNILLSERKESFLQCVFSVFKQTYSNIEYILIDGDSHDGTKELVESLLEQLSSQLSVKYVSEPDNGIYHAMNRGLELASGDYIGFINSDDFYHDPHTFSNIAEHFSQTNADLIYGSIYYMLHDKNELYPPRFHEMFKRTPMSHQSLFCKKECFEKYGCFNTDYLVLADYNFMLKAFLGGALFSEINEIVATCRAGGFATLRPEESLAETEKIFLDHKIPLDSFNLFRQLPRILKNRNEAEKVYFRKIVKKKLNRDICRWIVTIRLRKGNRAIKFFGINLLKEEI